MNALLQSLTSVWLGFGTHLWQTTLVLLGMLALDRLFRRAPARWLNVVWSLAFLKLMLPLALLGGAMERLLAHLGLPDRIEPGLGPLATGIATVRFPASALGVDGERVSLLGQSAAAALSLLWIAGAGRRLVRVVRAWRAARALPAQPALRLCACERLRLEQALSTTSIPLARVSAAEGIALPCVVGLYRPRILVPRHFLERLSADDLRMLLLHEEAHRRRREPLREALAATLASLYFFHPLVALARRRLRESAELLCDEHVLNTGVDGRPYVRALAATVQMALRSTSLTLAVGIHRGTLLGARIERLLQPGRFAMKRKHYAALAALIGLLILGTVAPVPWIAGCERNAPVERAAPEPPPETSTAPVVNLPGPMPQVLEFPTPDYPEDALRSGIEGIVRVQVLINREGKVEEARAIDGPEPLVASALAAARAARFLPAVRDGRPMATWVEIPTRYAAD